MKKLINLVIYLLFVLIATGQNIPYPNTSAMVLSDSELPEERQTSLKGDPTLDDWAIWADDWSRFQAFDKPQYMQTFTVFPGKAKTVYWNDDFEEAEPATDLFWHSVGICFDPKDMSWFNPTINDVGISNDYSIDSIQFTLAYIRRTHDTIVDKLIVQTYKGKQIRLSSQPNIKKQGIVGYSSRDKIGSNFTDSVHINLTAADSSTRVFDDGTFFSQVVQVAIPKIDLKAGEKFAVTVSFKPGFPYDDDDTLFLDSRLEKQFSNPKNPMNTVFLMGRQQTDLGSLNSPVKELESYNNGMFINANDLAKSTYTGNSFVFGNNVPVAFYPRIGVKISAKDIVIVETDEVNQVYDGFGLGKVYPNPAKKGHELNLSFAVQAKNKVKITVFDLSGKKMMDIVNGQFDKGQHNTSFGAGNLEPGMYLYTMTAGPYSKTQRFTITD